MLSCRGISAGYGSGDVIRGVNVAIRPGSIAAVLGPNGAGKSTLMKVLSGALRPNAGAVLHGEREVTRLNLRSMVKRGVVFVPERRELFPGMTVQENLLLGAATRSAIQARSELGRVHEIFPRLRERASQRAGSLSGGEQQMLAVGRALMARPSVLLIDEPSFGLAPAIVKQIGSILRDIRDLESTSVLLVEQNLSLTLDVADDLFVLAGGQIQMSGSKQQIGDRDTLAKAYLN